jgi:hypothetical protein
MMGPVSEKYPWHRTRAGESFFVPALDLQATMVEGLRVAKAFYGVVPKASAQPAVFNGMLGVMFKLKRQPPRALP